MRLKIAVLVFIFLLCFSHIRCYALGLSAHSAVVIDGVTGEVVYEKNAHQKRSMASTTKIMTAICALENGKPDDMVEVHPGAVGIEGSSIYLGHGEVISLRDLTYGLMLNSGNDAAVAIAMHISGSIENFAALMNETAVKIGASNTSFKNPNGLDDEGHFTTAYDLAQITRYGMNIPAFAEIVGTLRYDIPWQGRDYPRKLKNHNKLLGMYEGCDGVKTGFTKKSGRCLVSSATKEGYRMIAVTLNAPDDWNDHMRLLDYAFENYESRDVIKKDEYLKTVEVRSGVSDRIPVHAAEGFSMPVKNGGYAQVQMEYNIPDIIDAPVNFGQKVGEIAIYHKGNLLCMVDAVSHGSSAYEEPETFIRNFIKIIRSFVYILK